MQERGANRNPARVHVEKEAVDAPIGAYSHVENEQAEDPGAWVGRLVQQLSGVWGYAIIGSASNLSLVAAMSSMQWTDWEGSTEASTSTSSSASPMQLQHGMPKHNRLTMAIVTSVLFPIATSIRTTFTVASNDPLPFAADQWQGWKYAPHCLIVMLSSTLIMTGLSYTLPESLGAHVHFYFADTVSIVLCKSG